MTPDDIRLSDADFFGVCGGFVEALRPAAGSENSTGRVTASGTPKHLRVGVNMAMSDHTGLVRLLLEKGVITEGEYLKAIADEAERERDRYQVRLTERYGVSITLR
jgi:hypothetical protein